MQPIRVVGLTTVDDSARARRSSLRIWIWPVMTDQAVGVAEETMCSIECQRSERWPCCIPALDSSGRSRVDEATAWQNTPLAHRSSRPGLQTASVGIASRSDELRKGSECAGTAAHGHSRLDSPMS